MFNKILFLAYIVGIGRAVFIDTTTNNDNGFLRPHGWQMVKVYHPPSSAVGYKYEPYAYPKYEFEYSVSDKKTGDHKHHHEERDGDRVRGEYSLLETDGSLRKVQYHADDQNGFNAIVSKLVNKHNDHAVSFADHTRFFYPMGHNVKINHYFPGKNYHYQNIEKPESDKIIKPVHEEISQNKNDENQVVHSMIESGDKLMQVKPLETADQNRDVDLKPELEVIKSIPISVIPSIVSAIPENMKTEQEISENVVPLTNEQTSDISPSNELTPSKDDQKVEKQKEEPRDSEEAASYYHTKFYYIAY